MPSISYLPLLSCFLTPGVVAGSNRRGKRSREHERALSATPPCCGAVFGTFLSSLVTSLTIDGLRTAFVVRVLKHALQPIADAARNVRGPDARVLCLGLAASRPVRQQISALAPRDAPPPLHSSCGHASTVFGACAAIYSVFAVVSRLLPGGASQAHVAKDVVWMLQTHCVERMLEYVIQVVNQAVPASDLGCVGSFEVYAADAEQRALRRAAAGDAAARPHAAVLGEPPADEFARMLAWFARAAWPAGEMVSPRTHDEFLRQLSDVRFFLAAPTAPPTPPAFVDVVPLDQLADTARPRPDASDSDAASVSTRTTGSAQSLGSIGSVGSVGSAGSADGSARNAVASGVLAFARCAL
jgi:hypothetical protein